jgi:beta-galactosidase
MFFRFRPASAGAEIYWLGLINHDDSPSRRYAEARQLFGEFQKLEPSLLGTHVRMDIAIAGADFDAQEAHKTYAMELPSPEDDGFLLFRECYRRKVACSLIHPADDLSRIKALYVPHWVIWDPAWTERVRAFVESGGVLVVTALTATRDALNRVLETAHPGAGLAELCGVRVLEFGPLAGPGADGINRAEEPRFAGAHIPAGRAPAGSAARDYRIRLGDQEYRAGHCYERIEAKADAEIIGTWSIGWMAGQPAVTCRKAGRGHVIYLASYLVPGLTEALVDRICCLSGVSPIMPDVPEGVDVTVREAADRRLTFISNTGSTPLRLLQSPQGHDLLSDHHHDGGELLLGPYDCHVIETRHA